MRDYRLGLVQTQNQLRFAYEAIINANENDLFKEDNKEDDLNEEDSVEEEEHTQLINDEQINEKELRRRKREQKSKTTMEHIKRIKDKQKEIDNSNHKQKIVIKYAGIIFGVTLLVGSLYYSNLFKY